MRPGSPEQGVSEPYVGYLFAYFKGDSIAGEQIYFAISRGNNALIWDELNDGKPVLRSGFGTLGVRDPFLLRLNGDSGFCLLATDLSIGSGTTWQEAVSKGSRAIEVWLSQDLIHWSEQKHVVVAERLAGNAWAPKAIFDPSLQTYVVYWSSTNSALAEAAESNYHRVFCSQTRDFLRFSSPKLWIDAGDSVIDVSLVNLGERWLRFSKDEGKRTNCSDILMEVTDTADLFGSSTTWSIEDACIASTAQLGRAEGPIGLSANPGDENGLVLYLFVDLYESEGYVPLITSKVGKPQWRRPHHYSLPTGARHGSIIPITNSEAAALTSAFSGEFGDSEAIQ